LFETWTTSLGLPLREQPRDLALTRWVENDATALLLLETDEPLPFSRDVSVVLSKRTRIHTFPPFGDVVVDGLELDGDRIVAPLLPPRARNVRRILRAVDERGVLEAEIFDIARSSKNALLANRTRTRVEWPRELGRPEPGTLVFLDDQGRPLFPPISPFDIFVWKPVPMTLLTNREETAALLVPGNGPLGAGSYRLEFRIDRRRWPAATPDAVSNYRATATLAFSLA
jgi:hypothetical protein